MTQRSPLWIRRKVANFFRFSFRNRAANSNFKLVQGNFSLFFEKRVQRTKISFQKSTETEESVLFESFSPEFFFLKKTCNEI